MGLMKINKILKKYKRLHKIHIDSWEDAQNRIRKSSEGHKFPHESSYMKESYDYQVEGNRLFDAMMGELEGQEVFPKKLNN